MHRDRFVDQSQFARHVIELPTHLGQALVHAGLVVALVRCIEEAIERGADEPGFGGAAVLGGDCQSRNKILADIDADFSLHGTPCPMTATRVQARNDGTFEHLALSAERIAEPCGRPGIVATLNRASRISHMFDAGPHRVLCDDRKAANCIGASCKPHVSRFRRDQRAKTGASVSVSGKL
ncbi:MAG TPA: hypothetical protein VKR55_19310 [Bradyrhizobium sp.]|uniref:hypothetical protein n=1 Tax=Bradyrhizobium sp. TaxID=376 RepID=UPI002B8983B5|nr:hypothetical protein [Bradyrhizobium sp.]HLZ04283.1 hypothetical protein [Bradyrhizobium sp.]